MPTTDDRVADCKSIMLVGRPGGGKTTQFNTLPGKKFLYIFDPHALDSLGKGIDYEMFSPDLSEIDLAAKTLKSGIGDKSSRRIEPRMYQQWEADFNKKDEGGFFEKYDWIGMDSFTSFEDILADRVLHLNGRLGKQREQADHAAIVSNMTNIFRALTAYKARLFCTAHIEPRQNDTTKKTYNHLMMTGKLRTRLPILFSNILSCVSDSDEEQKRFLLQTVPDRETPDIRCSIPGLEMWEDVTLDMSKPLEGQGLGGLLVRAGIDPRKKTAAVKGRR